MAQNSNLKAELSSLQDKYVVEVKGLRSELSEWRAKCEAMDKEVANCQRAKSQAIEIYEREKAKLIKSFEKKLGKLSTDCELTVAHMDEQLAEARWMAERSTNIANRHIHALGKQLQRKEEEVATRDTMIYGEGGGRVGRPRPGLESRVETLENTLQQLRESLNLTSNKLPEPCVGDETHSNALFTRNVQFVSAALDGRDPRVIASSLHRNGQLGALLEQRLLQPFLKKLIGGALSVMQNHWSARHAVILMQEVHTSRSEFDSLRHLLSFKYSRAADSYQPIKVWVNKFDSSDTLSAPTLAARGPREKDRSVLCSKCGVESSEDGIVSAVASLEEEAAKYVAHYWWALDPRVQNGTSELVLVLTGDATGGWRGDAVTHGELGIASWAKGKAQSRLTLLPLFLFEGDDSAENLRNRGPQRLRRRLISSVSVGNFVFMSMVSKLTCRLSS